MNINFLSKNLPFLAKEYIKKEQKICHAQSSFCAKKSETILMCSLATLTFSPKMRPLDAKNDCVMKNLENTFWGLTVTK